MVEEAEVARDHLLPVELQEDHQRPENDVPYVSHDGEDVEDVEDAEHGGGDDHAACE